MWVPNNRDLGGAGQVGSSPTPPAAPASGGEHTEAFLETPDEVGVDVRFPLGVAARGLGAWLFRFADAERVIENLIGVGRPGVFGNEQKDAPAGFLEHGQKPPRAVEIQPADGGDFLSRLADARGGTSALAYVGDGEQERGFRPPVQDRDLLVRQPGGNGRNRQRLSPAERPSSSRRAQARSSAEGTYSSPSSPVRNWRSASVSWPSA